MNVLLIGLNVTIYTNLTTTSFLDVTLDLFTEKYYRPGQIARTTRIFCLVGKKKPLDLQAFSRIGKTIKKLQSVPNAIKNTSLNVIF